MSAISIFQFLDYREYLRAWFDTRKERDAWYSFKIMGDGVGLDQSQVFRILQGRLHISRVALPRFVEYLQLGGVGKEYFETLVKFGRSKREGESRELFARLLEIRGTSCRKLDPEKFEIYQNWYTPVLRSMIGFLDVGDDITELVESLSPRVSPAKVKQAMQLLERHGLIVRDVRGFWRTAETNLTTGRDFSSQLVRDYQIDSFALAQESILRHESGNRDISVTNLAVDGDAFVEIRALIRECRQKILQRVEAVQQPDRVLRFAHAVFPVAQCRRTP